MAAHVVVTDSTVRTAKIKVTPATFMNDVLEESCKKLKFNPINYDLKTKGRAVDLTQTFRLTGLSSGAKLDLIFASKTPGVVSVALQIPDSSGPGRRLVDKFPSNTTFWRVLRKFESTAGENLNFTARGVTEVANGSSGAGRIFYEMPNLQGLGREIATFSDLQETLGGRGARSGSVMIRLTFKKTDQPLEEAMAEIGQYFKEEEAAEVAATASGSEAVPAAEVEGITAAIARLDSVEPSGEDTDMKQPSTAFTGESIVTPSKRRAPEQSEDSILGPDGRPIKVYAAPSSDVPKAALQAHNEEDYEPTIAHAKLHQSRLLNKTTNQRMLGDAELEQQEKERAAKLGSVKSVDIKLRFPDQTLITIPFSADDTAGYLHDYVSKLISAEDQPFKLVWNGGKGPQTIPKDEKNLKKKLVKDLGLVSKVLVNFIWEDGASDNARKGSTLKHEYIEKAQEITVHEVAEVEAKAEDITPTVDKGKGKDNAESGGKGKGMPKWLKLPGKK